MEKVTEQVEWGRGGKALYDWETILNGETWALTKGEDFDCSVDGFRSAARNAATKRNISIRTKITGETVIVMAEGMMPSDPVESGV